MNKAEKFRTAHPDVLLAEHLERHVHVYQDVGMFIACLLLFSGSYCTVDILLGHLW
jgi:hypothetical protein